MSYRALRGTHDILPDSVYIWNYIEEKARAFFRIYAIKEIRTPVIEDISLFLRSLGDSTDIVEKQMFTITRGEDKFVLRPEGTAGVVRAYCEHRLDKTDPFQRYFYIGPMFRGERPQKGRLRQFHHIGVEIFSSAGAHSDAETVFILWSFLSSLGLRNQRVKINSLGCSADKLTLSEGLRQGLSPRRDELCPDCQRRFDRNIFRVLDCKNPSCRQIVSSLAIMDNYLCSDCRQEFDKLLSLLEEMGVRFERDPFLVRGLDYYEKTVFEVVHPGLGKGQDAMAAGGRYDGLVREISGGKLDIPGIGFAIGMERLIIAMQEESISPAIKGGRLVAIVYDAGYIDYAFEVMTDLRANSIPVLMDFSGRSIKSQMRWANKLGADYVLIIGAEEASSRQVSLKDMHTGQQTSLSLDSVVDYLI